VELGEWLRLHCHVIAAVIRSVVCVVDLHLFAHAIGSEATLADTSPLVEYEFEMGVELVVIVDVGELAS
jgi:hypothetical protein